MDKDQVISIIRAIVTARKSINEQEIQRDFREIEGQDVPIRKFGFNRLDDFLEASGEFILIRNGRDTQIKAKISENAAHISRLVAEQKSSSKRRRGPRSSASRRPAAIRNMYSSAFSNAYSKSRLQSNNGPRYPTRPMFNRVQPLPAKVIPVPKSIRIDTSSSSQTSTQNICVTTNRININRSMSENSSINKSSSSTQQLSGRTFNTENGIVSTVNNIDKKCSNDVTTKFSNSSHNNPQSTEKNRENVTKSSSSNVQQQSNISKIDTNVTKQLHSMPYKPLTLSQKTAKLPTSSLSVNISAANTNGCTTNISKSDKTNLLTRRLENCQKPIDKPPTMTITVKNVSPTHNPSFNHQKTSKLSDRLQNARIQTVPKVTDNIQRSNSITSIKSDEFKSPIINTTATPLPEPMLELITHKSVEAKDYVSKLANYCIEKIKTVPEYEILKIRQKDNRIHCKILINKVSYTNYPVDYASETEAKEKTARYTLERLKDIECKVKYEVCLDSDIDLAKKIYDTIKAKTHGVLGDYVPELFEKKFEQSLPSTWIHIVKNMPQWFSIEDCVDGRNIIYANILDDTCDSQNDISPSQLFDNHFTKLPKLLLPNNDKEWNVFVSNPVSTIEIWGRLVGANYSDRMHSVITDIEENLSTKKQIAQTINVGCIYLVIICECVNRVRIIRNDHQTKRSLCFLIDEGEQEWINMNEIYLCDKHCLQLPPQAICFTLIGLEDLAENPNATIHLQNILLNKIVVGITQNDNNDELSPASSTSSSSNIYDNNNLEPKKISIDFYDTSSKEDIPLNPMILEEICKSTPPPQLKNDGVTNVTITHVNESADIYCHVQDTGIHYIEKIIYILTSFDFNCEKYKLFSSNNTSPQPLSSDTNTTLYLVLDSELKKWYRATILTTGLIEYSMFYVDYGMVRSVSTTKIFKLEGLSMALSTYPYQAVKMHLNGVNTISSSIVSSLKGILTPSTKALVKMVLPSTIPKVNVYKYFDNNNSLMCINEILLKEDEINASSEFPQDIVDKTTVKKINDLQQSFSKLNTNNTLRPPKTRNVINKPLKPCLLPSIGERFDVKVITSSNPSNFVVCSNNVYPQMNEMMCNLQNYCKNNPDLIKIENINVGEIYAGNHLDGNWYRVIIKTVFDTSTVAWSCDFGEMMIVNNNKLKILPEKFRELPMQGVKAKLHGVKPINMDWEIEDCLYFQNLTHDKSFVSGVKNIIYDDNDPLNTVLELTLIDVTTDTDVYINEHFIANGRAISTSS